jgi:hypothetical protein
MSICLQSDSKERINSTSKHWVNWYSALKQYDREDALTCQNCHYIAHYLLLTLRYKE